MKKITKSHILIFVLILIIVFFRSIFYLNKDKNVNLKNVTPEINTTSSNIVKEYLENEDLADKKFNEKIIKLTGIVKEISLVNNEYTLILYSKNSNNGVLCELNDKNQFNLKSIKVNQKIALKGICKGFLEDVILLNCHIISIEIDE